MAKFVLTTCAACLARQKPVSTSAKPACMKITSTAPMTIQSRFKLTPRSAVFVDSPVLPIEGSTPAPAAPAVTSTARIASAATIPSLRFESLTSPPCAVGR